MEDKLKSLIEYVQAEGRVCPAKWNEFWEMLPNKKQKPSGGWIPSLPLILAAWWDTTAAQKKERLREQIEYAAQQKFLDEVDKYLRNLGPDEWIYGDGLTNYDEWKRMKDDRCDSR